MNYKTFRVPWHFFNFYMNWVVNNSERNQQNIEEKRMDKEHNKTIKICFTWVAILACVWTIGYFVVGNEREKRTEQRLRVLEQQIEREVENNVGNN